MENGRFTSICPKWVIDKYVEDFWDMKFDKQFEVISCPVLMIPSEEEWKSEGIKLSIENSQRFLKSSKVALIFGGFHAYVAFQYPEQFSNVIHGFYKESSVFYI